MASGFHDIWASISSWLQGLDARGVLLFLGEKLFEGLLQAVAVVVIGWLVLYRQWRQLTQGRSDQVVFSANLLTPIGEPDRPAGGWRAVSAPAPDRAAAADGRPAPGQRGAAPGDAQPGRAGHARRPDPRHRGHGRLRDRQRRRQQRRGEPGVRRRSGATSGCWRSPARIGRSSASAASACCWSAATTSTAWRPGTGAASTSWSRNGTTSGGSSRSTRSRSASRRSRQRQEQARGQDIQQNLLPLVDRQAHHPAGPRAVAGHQHRGARSSSRPSPSTGSVICRRSPSWG